MNTKSLLQRYRQAARLTGPKIASTTGDTFVEGCWLDERRYSFAIERFDASTGRSLRIPSIAHIETSTVEELAPLDAASKPPAPPAADRLYSPDSKWVITGRVDERSVPQATLIRHVSAVGSRPAPRCFNYPLPGDPLPVFTYVATHLASGQSVSFDDFPVEMALSPLSLRMAWFGGADCAWFVRFDRHCRQADLIRLDLANGTGRVVLSERAQSGYLDLHPIVLGTPNVRTLASADEVIWFSERDGWGHLYLHDAATGALKNQITHGAWQVRDLVHVDEKGRSLLFLAGGIDPQVDRARRSLCSVNLDGSGFEVLLGHEGDIMLHNGISPDGRFGVVEYLSLPRGNRVEIVDLQSRRGFTIETAPAPYSEVPPRHFTALAADGVTQLHGALFFPSDFNENQSYPLIDYIYPGLQVAHQPQAAHSVHAAPAQSLAELGFVTMMLDTRGMPIGSRAFRQAGYPGLLEPQLADHAAVVSQLADRFSFIDANPVGIVGQSAGGAAVVRALCDHGNIFKVGVAACAYDDPRLCPASWADKYLGPGAEAFTEPANNMLARKLVGKLLLIAGDMDESVHLSHTLSLVDALIRANKDFDLLIVPGAGHDVLMTNCYAQRRCWDFFVRHLLGEAPPADFAMQLEPHELTRFARKAMQEARQ